MKSLKTNSVNYFQFNHFSKFFEIKHFISTRNKITNKSNTKNLNISLEADMPSAEVLENRKLLSETVISL